MEKKFITIGGEKYRCEANWNAISAFLTLKGADSFANIATLTAIKPSDVAPMMAAAVNEGERLEGHDVHFTPEEVGAQATLAEITEFINVYTSQLLPQNTAAGEKKE